MSLKITLINPRPPETSNPSLYYVEPLGLLYIASKLKKEGVDVKIIDCHALNIDNETLRRILEKRRPDIVGVTSISCSANSALQCVATAKSLSHEPEVYVGGIHFSFEPEKALKWKLNGGQSRKSNSPKSGNYVDGVVIGEGIETFSEVVQKRKMNQSLKGVSGMWYWDGGRIARNPRRSLIKNLDSLPFLSHEMLPLESYKSMGQSKPFLSQLSSTGCAFRCNFCSAWKINRNPGFDAGVYRTMTPKRVVDELEYASENFGKKIMFHDDTHTINQQWVLNLCKEIKERGLNLDLGCETRVDLLNERLINEMHEAGYRWIFTGVETKSQRVLNSMNKGITPDQTKKTLFLLKDRGFRIVASMVLFWPGDTIKDVRTNLNYMNKLDPDIAAFTIATPLIGSDFYYELRKQGKIITSNWDKYDLTNLVFEHENFSPISARMLLRWGYFSFYIPKMVRKLCRGDKTVLKPVWHGIKHLIIKRPIVKIFG
jgi:anaerobic magnesium-protoporphyrin IX monomethyl ester cyclase